MAAAEAPFVNVPCHINIRDGNIALTNNDHTLLGLRASTYLMPYLPEKYRLLPLLQSVWYIGAGLDIWNQLLYKYPGRYATMKGVQVPSPSYGPKVWLEDTPPIREEGSAEERLHSYMIATMTGDSRRAHGLFLGLAEDPANRPALRETIEFLGLIDLQETVIGRKARNTGHKAIRARAVTDLANYIGWEKSHGVYYMGVPDMAVGPLYYSLYDAASVRINAAFPEDAGKNLRHTNQTPLSPGEVEEMLDLLMTADQEHRVANLITTHLKNGKSIKSLGDIIRRPALRRDPARGDRASSPRRADLRGGVARDRAFLGRRAAPRGDRGRRRERLADGRPERRPGRARCSRSPRSWPSWSRRRRWRSSATSRSGDARGGGMTLPTAGWSGVRRPCRAPRRRAERRPAPAPPSGPGHGDHGQPAGAARSHGAHDRRRHRRRGLLGLRAAAASTSSCSRPRACGAAPCTRPGCGSARAWSG